MVNFRPIDRATPYLLPPSVDDWLPKDHLARFVVDIVDQLDVSELTRHYRGTGSAAYHPSVMLGLLIYGYATGVYSSRRIEAATHDSIAFRYIAANEQPDHDSLCTFRRRFLKELKELFVQVLGIARQMKLLQLGTIALDGTKVHANASRHSALSYGHAQKIEAQLEGEVKELLARDDGRAGDARGGMGLQHRALPQLLAGEVEGLEHARAGEQHRPGGHLVRAEQVPEQHLSADGAQRRQYAARARRLAALFQSLRRTRCVRPNVGMLTR